MDPFSGRWRCRLFGDFRDLAAVGNVDHAERIQQLCVEIFLKKCASEDREARKRGRRGNKRPATDLGKRVGKIGRGNVPELPNTTFSVVISRVPNGNNDQTSSIQLHTTYMDVRHWEELIDFIKKIGSPKDP